MLQMDRADKAEATLREMQKQDDDSTLTELCKGWLNCYRGGAQAAEQALYAFQELAAKFGRTTLLLNNLAACHMHLQNYAEAWRQLDDPDDCAGSGPASV